MSENYNHTGVFAVAYTPDQPENAERTPAELRAFVIQDTPQARALFRQYVSLDENFDFGKKADDMKPWALGQIDLKNDKVFQEQYAPLIGDLHSTEAVEVNYRTGRAFDSSKELPRFDLQQKIESLIGEAQRLAS